MFRLLLLLFIIFLKCLTADGQKNHFQSSHLDISRGLSNNQVTSILKDQNGFLWVGTMSGLSRYDGYQFKVFRNDPEDTSSISDDYIRKIKECPQGKIWIETRGGTNIYDPATEKFDRNTIAYLRRLGIPSNLGVYNIIKDKEGNYLIHTNNNSVYNNEKL